MTAAHHIHPGDWHPDCALCRALSVPLDPDPLTVTAQEQAAWDEGYERGVLDSLPPRVTVLVVALIAAIVGGLLAWSFSQVASAAPRSAATAIPAELRSAGSSGNPSLPSGAPWVGSPSGAPLPASVVETQDPGEIGTAIESGIAAYAALSFGPRYLALPEGPGARVRICSQAVRDLCLTRVSTDAGPDLQRQREGRVADLSWWDFTTLCRCSPEVVGLIRVTIEYSVGAEVTPPATDP